MSPAVSVVVWIGLLLPIIIFTICSTVCHRLLAESRSLLSPHLDLLFNDSKAAFTSSSKTGNVEITPGRAQSASE